MTIDELIFEVRDAKYTRDNNKEVVISRTDGLMWQDNSAVLSNNLRIVEAIAYCDNLVFAEYDDWRVPYNDDYTTFKVREDQTRPVYFGGTIIGYDSATNPNAQQLFQNNIGGEEYYWALSKGSPPDLYEYISTRWKVGSNYSGLTGSVGFDERAEDNPHITRCVREITRDY